MPTASVNFRPLDALVDEADRRLADAEGHGLEKLVATLYEERSRKGIGDFALTSRIRGFWDRQGTELDMVALDETDQVLRVGTCKRSATKLVPDLPAFDGHIERFLGAMPRFKGWRVEKVAIAPRLGRESREAARSRGCIAQDLVDLTQGLQTEPPRFDSPLALRHDTAVRRPQRAAARARKRRDGGAS